MKRALLCAAVVWCLSAAFARAEGLRNVPLHDAAYDELDKWLALCGRDHPRGIRPFSRLEFADVILRERMRCSRPAKSGAARLLDALERRLTREFAEEIAYREQDGRPGRWDVRWPIPEGIALRAFGETSDAEFLRSLPAQRQADETADGVYNHRPGYEYAEPTGRNGATARVLTSLPLEVEDHLALVARPVVEGAATADGDADRREARADFETLSFAVQGFNIALRAGRDEIWWGPGRYGTLMFTDNAGPLDMVTLGTYEPFTWPWVFRVLGPTRIQGFVTRLERDRAVSEPWVAGVRATIMPFERLELGATRIAQFGGDREDDQGLDDASGVVAAQGEHTYGGAGDTNQLAAIDLRLSVPETRRLWKAWQGFMGWVEIGAESYDANNVAGVRLPIPSVLAQIYGLALDFGRFDMDAEFVDTNTRARWYTHYVYEDGYTYRGEWLGHPYGWGALSADGAMRFHIGDETTLSLDTTWRRNLDPWNNHEIRNLGVGPGIRWAKYAWRIEVATKFWRQERLGDLDAESRNSFGAEGRIGVSREF